MLRTSSSTISTFFPDTFSPCSRWPRNTSFAVAGSFSSIRWRKSAVSLSSFSGELAPLLRMTDSADLFSRASSFFESSLPVYTTTGTSWNLGWLLKSSRKRSPSSFGSSRSSTTVSNVSASSFSKPARPVATAVTSTSSPRKSSEMLRCCAGSSSISSSRSEEHTSELQSQSNLVCRLLLEKKKRDQPNRSDERTSEYQSYSSHERRVVYDKK